MKRNKLKLLFSMIISAALLLGFQNCAKLKPEEIVCDGSNDDNCSLANAQSTPVVMSLSQAVIEFNLSSITYSSDKLFQINFASDSVSSAAILDNCTLIQNVHWQKFKSLMLNHGICEYSYSVPADTAVCMGMAVPYARVMADGDISQEGIYLSSSMCSQTHHEVCGVENVAAFRSALHELKLQMQAGTACD